jgi:type II secretory pathway pseudopilin PulG
MGDALLLAVTILGMLATALAAWKLVQRQERGDAELEARLKADDERAARGRREELGLPPEKTEAEKNARRV